MTTEPEHPKCPDCGQPLDTPALEFLHGKVHTQAVSFDDRYTLASIPFVLFPAVAAVMQEFSEHQLNPAAERIAELHEMLDRQQNLTDEVIRDLRDERKKNRASEGGRV